MITLTPMVLFLVLLYPGHNVTIHSAEFIGQIACEQAEKEIVMTIENSKKGILGRKVRVITAICKEK